MKFILLYKKFTQFSKTVEGNSYKPVMFCMVIHIAGCKKKALDLIGFKRKKWLSWIDIIQIGVLDAVSKPV